MAARLPPDPARTNPLRGPEVTGRANGDRRLGPIVWAAAEERLRECSAAIVAMGEKRVWVLDEIPIYALAANGKRKKSDGWVVLVLTATTPMARILDRRTSGYLPAHGRRRSPCHLRQSAPTTCADRICPLT